MDSGFLLTDGRAFRRGCNLLAEKPESVSRLSCERRGRTIYPDPGVLLHPPFQQKGVESLEESRVGNG